MKNNEDKNKIIIATRTDNKGFDKCVKELKRLSKINLVFKSYIICNSHEKINSKIEVISDSDPICMTAFNVVIKKLNDELKNNKNKYHLLTFSKEVDLKKKNIERMAEETEKEKEIIVVGYRLKGDILSEKEYKQFANGNNINNFGIAYQVPWNTCALWNEKFIYGRGKKKLMFDKICEEKNNNLGPLFVKVDGLLSQTEFKGMEDGLAIAALISNNKNLKFKLINDKLGWKIDKKDDIKHKTKMARKNIVLSTFMNIKGYSTDKLMKAKINVSK